MDPAARPRVRPPPNSIQTTSSPRFTQHARIRDPFDKVFAARGGGWRSTSRIAAVPRARRDEERLAAHQLAELEGMDDGSAEFAPRPRLWAEAVMLQAARE